MYSTSKLDAEKEAIKVKLAGARWRVLSNYSGTTRTPVQLLYEWRVQMYNYGSNQGSWWPIRFENFDIVMIIIIIITFWKRPPELLMAVNWGINSFFQQS